MCCPYLLYTHALPSAWHEVTAPKYLMSNCVLCLEGSPSQLGASFPQVLTIEAVLAEGLILIHSFI